MSGLLQRRRRGRPTKAEVPSLAVRREAILTAALRRFAEFGYRATTVRQIAEDVGMLSGSLYHHFATKEDLLGEVVRPAAFAWRDEAEAIAALPDSAGSRIETMVRANIAALDRAMPEHLILYAERKFLRNSAEFADVVAAKRDVRNAWGRILRDGIAAGEFKAGLDEFLTVTAIIRMMISTTDWFRHDDGPEGGEPHRYAAGDVATFYAGFILSAIRA